MILGTWRGAVLALPRPHMTPRPHDALFKSAFATPAHAAALLRAVLPAALRDAVAWDRLTAEPASFVDVALADHHGDLLFSAPLQTHETARLFTLLEHQSTADPAMPLRGLRYQLRIWERDHKEQPAPWLPPIFVVVISHADGRWAAPRSLDDMLDPRVLALPGAAELVPRFSLIIEDLAQRSDDELQAQSLAAFPKLALWLLRDGSKPAQILRSFDAWISTMLEAQRAPTGRDDFHTLLNYMFHVIHCTQHDELHAKLDQLGRHTKEIEMTIADYLQEKGRTEGREKGRTEGREEGRIEGREKGRIEGRIAALRYQLLLKFKLPALDPGDEARLLAATPEALDRYLERVLMAHSLAEVFED